MTGWTLRPGTDWMVLNIKAEPELAVYTLDGLAIETACADAMRRRHTHTMRPHFVAPPTPPQGFERQAGDIPPSPANLAPHRGGEVTGIGSGHKSDNRRPLDTDSSPAPHPSQTDARQTATSESSPTPDTRPPGVGHPNHPWLQFARLARARRLLNQ